jgi:hypothetical protein
MRHDFGEIAGEKSVLPQGLRQHSFALVADAAQRVHQLICGSIQVQPEVPGSAMFEVIESGYHRVTS